jgi:putative NADH-flavin reductase
MRRLQPPARIAVMGATGAVGRLVVDRLLDLGHLVTGQSRDASRLVGRGDRLRVVAFDPVGADGHEGFVRDAEAVVFALGAQPGRRTTLFSEATRHLLSAMARAGCARLVAITGVGAGATRGHGGFLYDRVIFPLLTRPLYVDKDRQEALISATELDWTILRPAPFAGHAPETDLTVVTEVPADMTLRAITRDEVAAYVVRCLSGGLHRREKVFLGHA